jgi:hypothetical protein
MRPFIIFLLNFVAPKNSGRPWCLMAGILRRGHEQRCSINAESGTIKVMDEISPFYRRDTRELDASSTGSMPPVRDPEGLAALLEERYHARQSGDYTFVSKLDRQLKQKYGVKAYDHPPVWTRLLSSPPTAFLRRQVRKQTRMMRQAFGPTGHPYQQLHCDATTTVHYDSSSIWCDLSVTEIHALLQRRSQCRASDMYEEADAIKLELAIHGVRVCDESLQWTTDPTIHFQEKHSSPNDQMDRDGFSNDIGSNGGPHAVRLAAGLRYCRDALSRTFEGESALRLNQRVEQLVQERVDALVRGELQVVDSLALELYSSYNVGVNDSTRTWSLGCDFSVNDTGLHSAWTPPVRPPNQSDDTDQVDKAKPIRFPGAHGAIFGCRERELVSETCYQCSSKSLPIPEQDKQRIEDLIQDRIHMREEARFLEADAVRRELWYTYVSTVVMAGTPNRRAISGVLTATFPIP